MSYYFDEKKRFVIKDYNNKKPFASFLPGIAGVNGIPMWVFYVNRGQAIASFGVQDKNGAMMEFVPAHKAYQVTALHGFRTFIKKDGFFVEPFKAVKENGKEKMLISKNSLELVWENKELGLKVSVLYFTLPGEDFAGLVRKVEIENISNKRASMEIVDGMPMLLPYGIEHGPYKELGHTLRAWMTVENLENKIPFYKLRASFKDVEEVETIKKGNFYFAFEGSTGELLEPIVDSKVIFDNNTEFIYPKAFLETSLSEILSRKQIVANKVPSAFTGVSKTIEVGQKITIVSIFGHISDVEKINQKDEKIRNLQYINAKYMEAETLVQKLTDDVSTKTAFPIFDEYARQSYLDNLLRGGYPLIFGDCKSKKVYHVYSRKHGDLERDYNWFVTEATYYSQGNGNFRDVNQNRRNDVFFNPEVEDFNVKMFMSLIQLDGYNPLVVKGCNFYLEKDTLDFVVGLVEENDKDKVKNFLGKTFTPGKLITFIRENMVSLKCSEDEFLNEVLKNSIQTFEADFGEGYWIDHWTYNMDLIESYLSIYPDKKEEFLFEDYSYTYYDSPVRVADRKDKYVLVDGKVRQYGAIVHDEKKVELINSRKFFKNVVRVKNGLGDIYKTNLFEKLLCLSLTKYANLDPNGIGIEMEAGKPGWNDSMNGLPGLFGSSTPELFELYRLLKFIRDSLEGKERDIILPFEIYELLESLYEATVEYYNNSDTKKDFNFWMKIGNIKETYRRKTNFGLSGETIKISSYKVLKILDLMLDKVSDGIEKIKNLGNGLYPTYIINEAVSYEQQVENGKQRFNHQGYPLVNVTEFKPKLVSYYLEGPTRALKIVSNKDEAKDLYRKVRVSKIYDQKLKMYKLNEPIDKESYEIGRARAFTPGWLENESIFVHMEYKYMYSLLKSGLYDEFFEDMKSVFVPFLDAEMYGRSTTENSSFIVSSANPDDSLHGQGNVARLSGSTAEFLSMWLTMMVGKRPFEFVDGKLVFSISPILPGWLFSENGVIEYKFLGSIDINLNNPKRMNTYGENGVKVRRYKLTYTDGRELHIEADKIEGQTAEEIRKRLVKTIEVFLE